MAISRQQVADLAPGDVIELHFEFESIIRGRLVEERGILGVAGISWPVRYSDGRPATDLRVVDLRIISHAPRFYVNHSRTKPMVGDVATYPSGIDDVPAGPWFFTRDRGWITRHGDEVVEMLTTARLLVDGETGLPVPEGLL